MDTRPDTYSDHPCFGMASRRKKARLHLPVAPRANARLRFAAGGPSRPAMLPEEALDWLIEVVEGGAKVDIVAITGPGDPLADPVSTLETLRLVRRQYPDLPLCVTTRGMFGLASIEKIARAMSSVGLSHVTVLVDAVVPEIAEKLFAWIRPSTKTVPLPDAARVLVEQQAQAVRAFKREGLAVKINTTVFPGYNAGHVEEVARTMARLGADIMAVFPCREDGVDPLEGAGSELIATVRDRVARHMPLMPAAETCGDTAALPGEKGAPDTPSVPRPSTQRPNVAVVSSNGMDVDLHLGHAVKVLIYGPREDGLACLLESREAPQPGGGNERWEELARLLDDCFVLLTASAGANPRHILRRKGVPVLVTEGNVEGTVDVLYGGGKKGTCKTR